MITDRAVLNAERAARHLEEQREISREAWRDGFFTCLKCGASALVAMFFFGLAMYVTDYALGMVYFWTALILGYSGMVTALLGFYARGEARGQW